MKSVLFINRVYPPVEGATGQLLAELAPELVRAGWKVTVLTAASPFVAAPVETVNGVAVERVCGLPFTRASHWRRAVSYLSLYPALLWRALRLPRHDVVVTLTDPPLLALAGWILSVLKGCRAAHWAQDLYPELAEELGVLSRGGIIATILRWLSTQALRRCQVIIAVGRCMQDRLLGRGLEAQRIEVICNWGHGAWTGAEGDPEDNPFRRAHQLTGRFVIMYSGNFGMAHPFEAIIDAAARLQSTHPSALFLFVGDGPRLASVQQAVAQARLSNVRFLPFQPRETLAESLGAADVHLASMEENLCGLVVPSKVAGVLSAGRPCLFLGPPESEAARLIVEHDFGGVIAEPTGLKLATMLSEWLERPEPRHEVNERAARVAPAVALSSAVAAFDRALHRALDLAFVERPSVAIDRKVTPLQEIPTSDASLASRARSGVENQRLQA